MGPTHRAQVWGGGPRGLKGKPCGRRQGEAGGGGGAPQWRASLPGERTGKRSEQPEDPCHAAPRQMISSHLLGAGVSDNLGVPSVSLLSEDAVASESGRVEGWLVGWLRVLSTSGVQSQLYGRALGSDPPVGRHRLSWGAHKCPSFLQGPLCPTSRPGSSVVTHLPSTCRAPAL